MQVGKYQTLGGSIFQIGTVCTIATFDPYDMEMGGGDIGRYLRLTEHFCSYHFRLLQQKEEP